MYVTVVTKQNCVCVQDVSVISDHRTKHQSSLPPSLNFDHLKKLLDVALITKDYRQASRYNLLLLYFFASILSSRALAV